MARRLVQLRDVQIGDVVLFQNRTWAVSTVFFADQDEVILGLRDDDHTCLWHASAAEWVDLLV